MGYKLIGYKEPDLFEFFTIEEYERFTESPDLTEGLVPVYVATEGETPVDAVNMTQERVDETAKGKHEWVGLTDEEIIECFDSVALGQVEDDLIINKHVNIFTAIRAIEAKLKEKNT